MPPMQSISAWRRLTSLSMMTRSLALLRPMTKGKLRGLRLLEQLS